MIASYWVRRAAETVLRRGWSSTHQAALALLYDVPSAWQLSSSLPDAGSSACSGASSSTVHPSACNRWMSTAAQPAKPSAGPMRLKALAHPNKPANAPRPPKPVVGMSPKQLATEIGECPSISSLMALVETHAESMNHIHATAALSRAAKIVEAHGREGSASPAAPPAAAATAPHGASPPGTHPALDGPQADGQAETSGRPAQSQEVAQAAERLAGIATLRVDQCDARELATIAWSLGKLGHNAPCLIKQIIRWSGQKLSRFKPQEASNLAWGLAAVKTDDEGVRTFFKRLMQELRPKLVKFEPREQAAVLWALATLGFKEGFFERFIPRALQAARQRPLSDFGPHELSVTLWSLATLQHRSPAFLDAALRTATPLLPVFKPQTLSNVAWALATLDHNHPRFVGQLAQEAVRHRAVMSRQSLTNVLWALSILEHDPAPSIQPLVGAACDELLATTVAPTLEQLRQVHQYLLTMEETGRVPPKLRGDARYQQLRASCLQAWKEGLRFKRPSECQGSVLLAVRELPACKEAAVEQPTQDGMFVVDIAVKLPDGTQVAVEVDGPLHFVSGLPDGPTMWRTRMLQARGWRVVTIPVKRWQQFRDKGKRQIWLLKQFQVAGVYLPGAPVVPMPKDHSKRRPPSSKPEGRQAGSAHSHPFGAGRRSGRKTRGAAF